jgi:methionyl-tRNA formyltransferase
MRTVFMGTPDFAVPVLEALLAGAHDIVAVYTRPDRHVGRGRRVLPTPVKRFALERGLPVLQPASLRGEEIAREMEGLNPEVVVVAAYGRIIPEAMLRVPAHGMVNVHPSLLPRHRGPSPVATAILEGASVTGVTIMLLDAGMDSGPILAQREAAVQPGERTGELTTRLFGMGAELLLEVLQAVGSGDLRPVPQDEARATVTRLLQKADGELDWSLPAVELERRVRAFDPWPGCFTRWGGRQLNVVEAGVVDGGGTAEGEVGEVAAGSEGLVVVTGRGLLRLDSLRLEGRRTQPAEEFVRGHADLPGARLPS